ncbi:hypothetical protein [Planctomicrobium sp. SH664]|uniref:hypothetical protein n=1 Tax=Planctomicrobium sp. SH664 TaxID=3448125 RepID=UPI003F5BF12C
MPGQLHRFWQRRSIPQKLMKKGVRAAQNITCIFNMARNGIHVYYNIIRGFPGESIDDYEHLVQLIPAISHFPPPSSVVPVLVTRFAPLHASPERFGSSDEMTAHWRYNCLFTKQYLKKRNLNHKDWAYYFDSPYREFSNEMLSVYEVVSQPFDDGVQAG